MEMLAPRWSDAHASRGEDPSLALSPTRVPVPPINEAFIGRFRHTIDAKGRLTLPAKLRGPLASGVVVTRGSDRCLFLFTAERWEELRERVRNLPLGEPRAVRLRRHLFAYAEGLVPDRQGRILISQDLREWAGLGNEVLIVGQDTHLEIWDSHTWDERQQSDQLTTEDWATLGI
jgi:MraZ protein